MISELPMHRPKTGSEPGIYISGFDRLPRHPSPSLVASSEVMGRLIPFFCFFVFLLNPNFYTAAHSESTIPIKIPIDPPPSSGRFRRAVNELNYYDALQLPISGGPQTGIKSPYQFAREDFVADDKTDLVALLKKDESDIWDKLLKNPFCQQMKTAAKDNTTVTKGFKWYMVVRFLNPDPSSRSYP